MRAARIAVLVRVRFATRCSMHIRKGSSIATWKPSNILIGLYDGRPVPKAIDFFGVAKATGTKLNSERRLLVHVRVGHAIGTWNTCGLEQAELEQPVGIH